MESESKEYNPTTNQIIGSTPITGNELIEREKDTLDAFLFNVYNFIIQEIEENKLNIGKKTMVPLIDENGNTKSIPKVFLYGGNTLYMYDKFIKQFFEEDELPKFTTKITIPSDSDVMIVCSHIQSLKRIFDDFFTHVIMTYGYMLNSLIPNVLTIHTLPIKDLIHILNPEYDMNTYGTETAMTPIENPIYLFNNFLLLSVYYDYRLLYKTEHIDIARNRHKNWGIQRSDLSYSYKISIISNDRSRLTLFEFNITRELTNDDNFFNTHQLVNTLLTLNYTLPKLIDQSSTNLAVNTPSDAASTIVSVASSFNKINVPDIISYIKSQLFSIYGKGIHHFKKQECIKDVMRLKYMFELISYVKKNQHLRVVFKITEKLDSELDLCYNISEYILKYILPVCYNETQKIFFNNNDESVKRIFFDLLKHVVKPENRYRQLFEIIRKEYPITPLVSTKQLLVETIPSTKPLIIETAPSIGPLMVESSATSTEPLMVKSSATSTEPLIVKSRTATASTTLTPEIINSILQYFQNILGKTLLNQQAVIDVGLDVGTARSILMDEENRIKSISHLLQPQDFQRAPIICGDHFERQESSLCGAHTLNNLFGKKIFRNDGVNHFKSRRLQEIEETGILSFDRSKIHLSNLMFVRHPINLKNVCEYIKDLIYFTGNHPGNYCDNQGNYEIEVLLFALKMIGYDIRHLNKITDLTIDENLVGYIVNNNDHWYGIQYNQLDSNYFIVNSLEITPIPTTQEDVISIKNNPNTRAFIEVYYSGFFNLEMPDRTAIRAIQQIVHIQYTHKQTQVNYKLLKTVHKKIDEFKESFENANDDVGNTKIKYMKHVMPFMKQLFDGKQYSDDLICCQSENKCDIQTHSVNFYKNLDKLSVPKLTSLKQQLESIRKKMDISLDTYTQIIEELKKIDESDQSPQPFLVEFVPESIKESSSNTAAAAAAVGNSIEERKKTVLLRDIINKHDIDTFFLEKIVSYLSSINTYFIENQTKDLLEVQPKDLLEGHTKDLLESQSKDLLEVQPKDLLEGHTKDLLEVQPKNNGSLSLENIIEIIKEHEKLLNTVKLQPKKIVDSDLITKAKKSIVDQVKKMLDTDLDPATRKSDAMTKVNTMSDRILQLITDLKGSDFKYTLKLDEFLLGKHGLYISTVEKVSDLLASTKILTDEQNELIDTYIRELYAFLNKLIEIAKYTFEEKLETYTNAIHKKIISVLSGIDGIVPIIETHGLYQKYELLEKIVPEGYKNIKDLKSKLSEFNIQNEGIDDYTQLVLLLDSAKLTTRSRLIELIKLSSLMDIINDDEELTRIHLTILNVDHSHIAEGNILELHRLLIRTVFHSRCAIQDCDIQENLKLCSKCNIYSYCGHEHQTKGWPDHKYICKDIKDIMKTTAEGYEEIIHKLKKKNFLIFAGLKIGDKVLIKLQKSTKIPKKWVITDVDTSVKPHLLIITDSRGESTYKISHKDVIKDTQSGGNYISPFLHHCY